MHEEICHTFLLGGHKGIILNSVINYSPSCRFKPVRLSFIFETRMKIFLMKSESFLSLYCSYATDTLSPKKKS